ncbi:ubiquitin-specific protease ubp2 [Castilleja foliolosa]|uniref:Ubiquitin carboxyl-terminal hydrolase n=1 Tax=Castilleja foliolosa TaxID=1961234 RepID=A0ABD3DM08_9LAMI
MAKKVKKKQKSVQKDNRVPSTSMKTVSEHATSISQTLDNEVSVVNDRGLCSHIDKGINMNKLAVKFATSGSFTCEDCRGHIVDNRGKKGKGGKHGKKGGAISKSESKAIWVCLECGHFSCGGIGFPTIPQSHAVRHAKQNHHPLAVHYKHHHLLWCFSCDKIIPAEKSEDGKHKETFKEVVRMLKKKPSEGSNIDVEDVWFGSGSVTNAVKLCDYQISVPDVKTGYSIRGLVNLGNTCFFNSIIQNLLAIHSLREYLFELDESVGPLIASLRKFFLETNSEAGLKSAINPRSVFGSLCTKAPQFRGYQQHDSHELLRCLLDGLSTEELSARKHNGSSITGPTFIDIIFGGQLSSTVSCLECGHSSTIYEPFLDLSLPVPTKKPPTKKQETKTAIFGPVARGKKSKPPPRRPGRNYPKMKSNNRPGESVLAQSTDDNSLGELQTITQPLEQVVPSPGDYALSNSIDPNDAALDMALTVEDLSSVENPKNEQAVENVGEQSISSESFAWLDYLEPGNDVAKETDDISAVEGFSNENALQYDVSLSNTMDWKDESNLATAFSATSLDNAEYFNAPFIGPFTRDQDAFSSFEEKENEKPLSSEVVQNDVDISNSSESNTLGNDNENPSQIQDSQVILLPSKEMEVSSSSVPGDEQDSSDFCGLGDLFNEPEPEVPFGPVFEANTKNGVIGNNSESDPDEVDNANAPVSVESCLAHFTKPEFLFKDEHAWQCDNCSKIVSELKIRSRSKLQLPISESVQNGCAENVTGPSEEIHETGECTRLPEHPETEINASDLLSENTEPQKSDACSRFNNEDVNPTESHKNGLAESDLLSAEHESESELTTEKEDVNLEKLKVKRDATKTVLITKVPSVLTIQLKRFSQDARGRLSKLNGHVNFKERIDLKPYMDPRCSGGELFSYRLVGLVEHMGSMRGGHYVAYVRGKSKENGDCVWYHASDAYVRQASLEEVMRSQAYILFYERI